MMETVQMQYANSMTSTPSMLPFGQDAMDTNIINLLNKTFSTATSLTHNPTTLLGNEELLSMEEMEPAADARVILVMFILWGIVLPMVAGVGLIGNILTMVVLWRREMHSTTILYLRALVVTDTGILIGSVITLTPLSCANYLHGPSLMYFKDWMYPHIHTPGYYMIMSLQQCNVWITVAVSMERYIAICHPFRAARLITRKKTIIVICTISAISFVYNIPHIFASGVVECESMNSSMSVTTQPTYPTNPPVSMTSHPLSSNVSSSTPTVVSEHGSPPCLSVYYTEFSQSLFYKQFRSLFYAAIIHVIPLLALIVLNSFLIKELMVMKKRRTSTGGTNTDEDNEANLSLVLVLIVIVFIICQTPGLISQFEIQPQSTFHIWLAVANLLFTTNSAVNFLIYTAFGRKFRRVLLRVFRCISKRSSRFSTFSHHRPWHYNDYEMSTVGDMDNSRRPSEISRLHLDNKQNNCNGNNGDCKPIPRWDHITHKHSVGENLLNGKQKINGV